MLRQRAATRLELPGTYGLDEPRAKKTRNHDTRFLERRQAQTLFENRERIYPQPAENRGVNSAHQQNGEAGVERQLIEQRLRLAKVRFGAVDLILDETPRIVADGQLRCAEATQLVLGNVDAISAEIVPDITGDVRQLQRGSELSAVLDRGAVTISKDG